MAMKPEEPHQAQALLEPGRNCWQIAQADHVAVLIDGDAYFSALRSAIAKARHSVFIVGWDIDSRLCLQPAGANDGLPEALGDFLRAVLARQRGLHIYVLNWDYTLLFALDREWLSSLKLNWQGQRRLHFRLDAHPVLGGSHHQKVVVIDDRLAFVGGIDLTHSRWDTPAHDCDHELRCNADGSPYQPFHDVQAMFDGPAARIAAQLVRDRWHNATGVRVPMWPAPLTSADNNPWPADVEPDFERVQLAVSRTEPPTDQSTGVREIRQLYDDVIAQAQHSLYFENQYFSSGPIAEQLAQRLNADAAPDIVVVSRRVNNGWLERMTMGVQRARVHALMKQADQHDRYRLYSPEMPGLDETCINVHAKVVIADDDFLSIGSANINNRSMVMDTECNIAIEARGRADIRAGIARVRAKLLGEHLDCEPDEVQTAMAEQGRLIPAIEALQKDGRTLKPLDPVARPEDEAMVPALSVLDPERIVPTDQLVSQLVPHAAKRPLRSRLMLIAGVALVCLALAALWRWTPLAQYVDPQALSRLAARIRDMPLSPLIVILAYVLGTVLMFPHSVLVIATGLVFGPVLGIAYALGGTAASAAFTFWMGTWLPRDALRRIAGQRANRLSMKLARRGIISVALLRQIPLGPVVIVNLICGASHLSLRDFMIGTMIGMTPGSIITVLFVHHFAEAVRHPSTGTFGALIGLAALLIGVAVFASRLLRRAGEHRGMEPA